MLANGGWDLIQRLKGKWLYNANLKGDWQRSGNGITLSLFAH
jgi:hypothetical protein